MTHLCPYELDRVERPLLKYYGSKWNLASLIINQFSDNHETYVDVFGGSASVLLQKKKTGTEVYNDINKDIVNLFEVVRNPDSAKILADSIYLTPWSRYEHEQSYIKTDDKIENARRLLVRGFLSYGSRGSLSNVGFRFIIDKKSEKGALNRFCNYLPQDILACCKRLQQVQIESLDYRALVERYDSETTQFYFDPPYVHDTRSNINVYEGEMTTADHEEFLKVALGVKGFAVISGYENELYMENLGDWRLIKQNVKSITGPSSFTECIWVSPNCDEAAKAQGVLKL